MPLCRNLYRHHAVLPAIAWHLVFISVIWYSFCAFSILMLTAIGWVTRTWRDIWSIRTSFKTLRLALTVSGVKYSPKHPVGNRPAWKVLFGNRIVNGPLSTTRSDDDDIVKMWNSLLATAEDCLYTKVYMFYWVCPPVQGSNLQNILQSSYDKIYLMIITGWAVAQTCCISQWPKYRKSGIFGYPWEQNPWTDRHETWGA